MKSDTYFLHLSGVTHVIVSCSKKVSLDASMLATKQASPRPTNRCCHEAYTGWPKKVSCCQESSLNRTKNRQCGCTSHQFWV